MSQRDYREAWEMNEPATLTPEQQARAARLLADAEKAHGRPVRDGVRIGFLSPSERPQRGPRPEPPVRSPQCAWVWPWILGVLCGVALCRWLLEVGG